jgi:alkanesulfonate monooxygenase SsuD/methylene tetrahydromethanopterin reductase-like flavin-dependent oxidoreductase (luciferase family)
MAAMAEERQPPPATPAGTAFALRDPLPWPTFAALAALGESLGYRGVFLPEIDGRDALAALAALAGETRTLLLGAGVVPMEARRPMLTAMAAATVQERSAGRAILGIGTGPARRGALEALDVYVRQVRALLRGSEHGGEPAVSLATPSHVPIWTAALRSRAVRTAGSVADGVLLNWCTPARVAEARDAIRGASEAAGRDPDAQTISVYVRACLDQEDPLAGLLAAKRAAGAYASYPGYARQFRAMGLGTEAAAAADAHAAGRPDEVPDELVDAVCLVGASARARERLEVYRGAGAHLPVVYPILVPGAHPDASIGSTLRALAPVA